MNYWCLCGFSTMLVGKEREGKGERREKGKGENKE
jgi:hypothetical protein